MRIKILVVAMLAGLAALAVVSAAPAGDFADAACSGDPSKICPSATTGQAYSVEFTLKEPGDCGPSFAVTSGGLPPGRAP